MTFEDDNDDRPTLRDMFACYAMNAHLSYSSVDGASGNWQLNSTPSKVAQSAYEYADAMMAARKPEAEPTP